MNGRLIAVFLAFVLGGCAESQPSSFQVQPAAATAVTIDQTLDRVFFALDQKSTTVNPMVKETMASVVDGAVSQKLAAVRVRMEQRLVAVDLLKEREVVGENDRGYLEARDNITPEQEAIRSDENADRRKTYTAIAALLHDGVDEVGRLRAQKIAIRVLPGVWLQGPDGAWYQKK
jgi:uncharacterized protein YdbL (DUF1318 family)